MKKRNLLLALLLTGAMAFGSSACFAPADPISGSDSSSDTTSDSTVTPELGDGYDVITVAEALEICKTATTATTERYYVVGTIDELSNAQYGSMTISDETGSIYVYGTYSADGEKRYNALEEKPVKGDKVLLYGTLQNYNGTMEIASGWIIDFEKGTQAPPSTEIETKPGTGIAEGYDVITLAQAIEICKKSSQPTAERYYIHATVKSITNAQYGAMIITDGTDELEVYGTYSADGSVGYADMEEKPFKGDEVLLHCTLQNFNGKNEVKNARLIAFKSNEGNVDESKYTQMSVEEARNAAEGTLIKVDGVVSQITYANGMKPNGLILIDETSSIYVFDGDLAARVQEGNKITILAEKTWWILETEQSAASKFGYKGCNQLTDVTLLENDNGNNAFDTAWVEAVSLKEIMDTPVTTDITSIVYKVNALVEKRDGNGFVNYYFFDIDGETGSYTYTQCNGGDFDWLDPFNGKICSVYLTVLNAKSSASGCIYRLLPIAVKDEGFTFNKDDAAEFAVTYYGVDQFMSEYTADPALEVNTVLSSALLGFENATISYSSDDTDVIYFETADGKTVMHCGSEYGTANVTVTGSYNGKTYQQTVAITYKEALSFQTITVAEAIAAAIDSEVTVKGIVGPSLVNQDGFYLFGEDGSMIAVKIPSAAFVGLEIGHEIVLKGMRERYVKDDASAFAGQTCIVNGEILVNYYGSHEYSTAKFVTDKNLQDFYELNANVDYSTTVYVLKATVNLEETNYYTKLNLTATIGGKAVTVSLYCSGAAQYTWLQAFKGQEITIEIAPCNWNDKKYWVGCVLAVRTENGKVLNSLNFDNY